MVNVGGIQGSRAPHELLVGVQAGPIEFNYCIHIL